MFLTSMQYGTLKLFPNKTNTNSVLFQDDLHLRVKHWYLIRLCERLCEQQSVKAKLCLRQILEQNKIDLMHINTIHCAFIDKKKEIISTNLSFQTCHLNFSDIFLMYFPKYHEAIIEICIFVIFPTYSVQFSNSDMVANLAFKLPATMEQIVITFFWKWLKTNWPLSGYQ